MSESAELSWSNDPLVTPKDITLITGGSGCVGCMMQTKWDQSTMGKAIFLSSKDGDLKNPSAVDHIFSTTTPTCVIHLAADVGGLFKNLADSPWDVFQNNLLMNENVVNACVKHKVRRAMFLSSTCTFSADAKQPMCESDFHSGPPHSSVIGYAFAKRILDMHISMVPEAEYFSVIPCNIYGPFDHFSERGHVISSLIWRASLAKEKEMNLVIRGTGNARRQMMYSGDLVDIILLMIKHYKKRDSVIVGPSGDFSIETIVENVVSNVKFSGNVVYDPSFPEGQLRRECFNNRLMKFLEEGEQDFCFTSLEEGISNTVKWFYENK